MTIFKIYRKKHLEWFLYKKTMLTMADKMAYKLADKKEVKFECIICDFNASDITKLNRHFYTMKHKRLTDAYKKEEKEEEQNYIHISHNCNKCGKKYNHRQSLHRHKKTCQSLINAISNTEDSKNENKNNSTLENCIMLLIQENKDFKNMLIENQKQVTTLIPKIGNNNTQNNTQNNNFNINFFLNEQCKDAMSMNEFIDSIEISMQDLIKTKDEGFASGISNIFIKGMSKLSPYQRPLHCTDVKRETLYVKNDKWEKDVTKEKITDSIKSVSAKQFKHINNYKDANPDFMQNDKKREEYFNILKNTTEPIENNSNKIIKNICPTVHVKANAECEAIGTE
jgi:hypothetical protein